MKRAKILVLLSALFTLMVAGCGGEGPSDTDVVRTATPDLAEQEGTVADEGGVDEEAGPEEDKGDGNEEPTTTPTMVEPTQTPPPTATPVPPTATPVPPTATPVPEAFLGDLVEFDGVSFAAVQVEDPAQGGQFYEPEEGTKLVATEIIVGNSGGDGESVNPLDATLVDAEGFTYRPELGSRGGQLLTADISPGERIRGWVAFEVPEGVEPAEIQYEFSEGVASVTLQAAEGETDPSGDIPLTKSDQEFATPETFLGDLAELDRASLAAVQMEDPAQGNQFYEPTEGTKLVAAEIIVGNFGGDAESVNPLDTLLVDAEGYVYGPELGSRDGQLLTVDISPGERVRGWIGFEVPPESDPAYVKYSFSEGVAAANLRTSEGDTVYAGDIPLTTTDKELAPPEARLGDLVEFDGASFAAVQAEDPAEPGQFYEPAEGTKLVATEIIVGNVAGEPEGVNPLDTIFVDSEGFVYAPELGSREGQLLTADILPGERVRGWVAFEVPPESEPAYVKYAFTEGVTAARLQTEEGDSVFTGEIPLTLTDEDFDSPEARLGDVVDVDGRTLVAEKVEDPATPGSFYTPAPGTKLIGVQIAIGNEAEEPVSVNPLYAYLIDSNHFLYEAELGSRAGDEQIETTDLASGERVRGWVAFEVPEASRPASLRYEFASYPLITAETGLAQGD